MRLSPAARVRLVLRVWRRFAYIRLRVRRDPLPHLVARLGRTAPPRPGGHTPAQLSRAVDRALRLGRYRPTCLVNALVLYRLLREEGQPAELVIGLPEGRPDRTAHAWVEIDGIDVGPPPGRGNHSALARYR